MHRNSHGIQKKRKDFSLRYTLHTQLFEKAANIPFFKPIPKTLVDNMPVSVLFRQSPPFTAVFANIQECVYECYVINAYVAVLGWQDVFNFVVLLLVYSHGFIIACFVGNC